MLARTSLAAALVLAPASARAQAWTEATVARLAAERAPRVLEAHAASRIARGAIEGEGLLPNPSLAWERQEAFDPNAQTQDIVTARVPLDLSGRPAARRALAELDAWRADADEAGARVSAVTVALAAFYRALAAERRVALFEEAQASLDEAVRVMAERRDAGDASGYETSRLALEAELARSRLAEARLDALRARVGLGAPLGVEEVPALAGDLEATAPAPLEAWLARVERRPELEALARAADAARRARDAADLAWLPRLDLAGGYNRVDGPVPGHGYALEVSVEVPLFDHGQGERARAAAAAEAVDAIRDVVVIRARAEVRAAHAALVGALAERARFGAATDAAREELARAVASGYRDGERTLVERIDAQRAVVENGERRLALDLAARLADVRLRGAVGAQ
jgi:cobalt-zinc-cadmium efflux system outer membrane protein